MGHESWHNSQDHILLFAEDPSSVPSTNIRQLQLWGIQHSNLASMRTNLHTHTYD